MHWNFQFGSKGTYSDTFSPGGFNGGGNGYVGSYGNGCGGGGGSTDIRTQENLPTSRILVAGGGGGDGNTQRAGGCGGGLQGGDAIGEQHFGKGGNQESGGKGVVYSSTHQTKDGEYLNGSDGLGQGLSGGGGGGGYYGGSGSYEWGGGGGSGYVSPFVLFGKTLAGNQTMPQLFGPDSIGNKGDGALRITRISRFCYVTCFCYMPHIHFLPAVFLFVVFS